MRDALEAGDDVHVELLGDLRQPRHVDVREAKVEVEPGLPDETGDVGRARLEDGEDLLQRLVDPCGTVGLFKVRPAAVLRVLAIAMPPAGTPLARA